MRNENKIGSLLEDPSDYFINTDMLDYIIKTKKIERKIESINWYEKVDLIIDIADSEPILLTKIIDDDIPYIRIENDGIEALEELLRYFYKKGYRRYK